MNMFDTDLHTIDTYQVIKQISTCWIHYIFSILRLFAIFVIQPLQYNVLVSEKQDAARHNRSHGSTSIQAASTSTKWQGIISRALTTEQSS